MCNSTRSNRFAKQDRLLSSKEFSNVFSQPIKSADAQYTVLAKANHLSRPRLGVIVSKKNVPTAVQRNRLKRVIRESFRTHKHVIKAFDVVVICKQRSSATVNQTLFKNLKAHWKFLNTHAQ